jgi:hypothetical protein
MQKTKSGDDSSAEDKWIARALRYYDAENLVEAFPSRKERRAMRALLEWFSLNSICAWRTTRGTYDAHVKLGKLITKEPEGYVIEPEKIRKVERLLGKKARSKK